MNKKNKELTREELRKSIIFTLIILSIILVVLVIIKMSSSSEESIDWTDSNYGDIVISETEPEPEEILPNNIFDAYGLEYEYTKIPSLGLATYIPIGWEVITQKDFIYFVAPDDVEGNYKYIEIALCVTDVGNIHDKKELVYISNYINNNIRNHNHDYPFVISTVTENQYVELKDGDELIGYYCKPLVEFIYEDNPYKSHWSPYTVFYQLNTNPTTTLFAAVVGPRNYIDEIDEIGKTIAYNTEKYSNTQFDFNTYEKFNYAEYTIGKMTYRVKNTPDVSIFDGVYNLSTDPTSLAFNSKLIVSQNILRVNNLEEYFTDSVMWSIWIKSNDVIYDNYTKWNNKTITSPTFNIDNIETVQMYNKECKKIDWTINVDISSNARIYSSAIMPARFTTYLVPDSDSVYSFTITYTTYQKYSALKYLEKTMQLTGFNN